MGPAAQHVCQQSRGVPLLGMCEVPEQYSVSSTQVCAVQRGQYIMNSTV